MPDTDIPLPVASGRTLVYDGLAQTDIDMANHRLLNLDDSNLTFGSAPPSVGPVAHQWLRSWNSSTRAWGLSQPAFTDISGNLTAGQQSSITQLGTVNVGVWNGSVLAASKVPTLSGLRLPVANVNLNGFKLVNVGLPSVAGDAVNLAYVNGILPGLRPKEAVQCATTGNIALHNLQTIDGFPVQDGQRVLVKNQTDQRINGIWRAQDAAAWVRAPDSDTATELNQAYCFVRNGAQNGGTAWVQNNEIVHLGTDPVHYIFFSQGTSGPPGPPGPGVPADGTTGQVLAKIDGTPYHTAWVTALYAPLGSELPLGGTAGMILGKLDSTPYHSIWFDGSLIFALKDHGLPDDALLVGSVEAPDVFGPPVDGMVLAYFGARPNHSVWIDGTLLFAPAGSVGLPSGGDEGEILVFHDGAPLWFAAPSFVPPGAHAGDVLTFVGPGPYDNHWATPSPDGAVYAILQTGQYSIRGTNSTTGRMMGLAALITPHVTGKIIVTVGGYIYNTDAGSAGAQICVGTGTAPALGGVRPVGSFLVGPSALRSGGIGANQAVPFSLTYDLYDLTAGTQIWIDLHVLASTPGTATIGGVTVSAHEIP